MEKVKISDVLWFQEGPGVRNTQYTSEGVKLLNVANLVDGKVDLSTSSRYISENEAYGKYKHFLVDDGDFIIASSGIKVEYFEKKMGFVDSSQLPLCMNTSTIRFKTVDKNTIDIRYFMYYLKSEQFKEQLSKHITGSAQLNFGPSHLNKMHVPVPNMEQQKYIVRVFDLISKIEDKRKKQLSKLDELVKARFVELFGDLMFNPYEWPVMKISDISLLLKSGLSRKLSDEDIGLPVIRSGNIQNGQFLYDDVKYWYRDDPQGSRTEDYILEDGDILVNFINSASQIGKTAIFRDVGRDCIYTTNIFRMKLASNCNEYYYNWFAMSDYYYKQLQNIIQPAVNQASFTTVNFLKLSIPLPPMELQNQFAAFVEQTDKSKLAIQKSLEKLELLKKALMQKYFG